MVDRCVCRGVTFEELKELADRTGAGLDELTDRTGCGSGCSMCVPYILKMLESGETRFETLPVAVRRWWAKK
ncbi:MAG: (2Fe-2S)-binding protein [Phycisphaerales bacterium]|nr:(2Fe-2S)-binding protein [Phycisphaerales bacterium]